MAKKTYEPVPEVPPELLERYGTMLEVLQGTLTVSEAARRLGISRNRFQSLYHRGLKSLLTGIAPGDPGRPGKPPREVELEQRVDRLERENERLRGRAEMIDRLLGVASGVIRGRVRSTRTRGTADEGGAGEGEDPEPEARIVMLVEAERELRATGLPRPLSCAIVGASPATLRRWRCRAAGCAAAAAPRAEGRQLADELRAEVEAMVRTLHGLAGADAIRQAVPGVSRRQAAAVKRETVTAMERERKAEAEHVVITMPGVVRGFDAMYVDTEVGRRHALVASDAAVSFRTTAAFVPRYDGRSVAAMLERDFDEHGAPLVLRADRAKCHEVPEVLELLRDHGVLLLHGPPHHPGYYGQLERQNREHREWLAMAGRLAEADLDRLCDEMLLALNSAWPRRSLHWQTSEEVWAARRNVVVDRQALREQVQDRAARIRRRAGGCGATAAMAERFAIEAALTKMGYLRREPGGWC